MAEFQSGTVTFLLTDIEGSTRLLKQLRDRYGEVLAEHREIVRAAFEEHGGHEIDSQGDAFFGCFARAKHAVAAAAAIQRRLAAHEWPDGASVRVRIGIHTGEAEVSDGRYHGVAVHRAARIMAAAHGGQVLLSQTTRDLLEDEEEEAAGLMMRDLGEHRLKDLDRPVRLYQLVIEGLPHEFPPPRTEADLGAAAEATLAPPPFYRRRTILVGALAGVIAAAIAIPIFALGGGGGSAQAAVKPDSVAEVDPTTGDVVRDVNVGTNPGPVTAGEGFVWVANLDDKTVSEIDPSTGERKIDIPTADDGGPPTGIAAGFGTLWVAYSNNGRVDRVDPRSSTLSPALHVHEEIGLRNAEGARVLTVAHGNVWLGNLDATVLQIGPNNVIRRKLTVGGGHWPSLAVAPDGTVWEFAENDLAVSHVDPRSGAQVGSVPVSGEVRAIVAGPNAVWAVDATEGQVLRIDPTGQTIRQRITVGNRPTSAALAAGSLWVVNGGSGSLSEIDTQSNKVVRTIGLGHTRPSGIAYASGHLWVSLSRQLPISSDIRPANNVLRLSLPFPHPGPDLIDPAALDNIDGGGGPWSIAYATCAQLLNYPDRPGKAGLTLVPEVATGMPTVTDGQKTYAFTLKRGKEAFRFSPPYDNTPVTAESFRYAIERTLAPPMHSYARLEGFLDDVVGAKAYEAGRAAHIAGIRADGDRLTIRLAHPSPDFLTRLSMPQFCAMPTRPIPFPKEIGKSEIPGAGPYYVAASSPDGIVLKANPYYHGSRPHHFDEVDFIPDVTPAMVETGQADNMFPDPRDPAFAAIQKRFGPGSPAAKKGRQQLFMSPTSLTVLLALNTTRQLFQSASMRRALSYATDRAAFINDVANPALRPLDHYLVPGFPGATVAHAYPARSDLTAARRLAAGRSSQAVFYYQQEAAKREAVVERILHSIGIGAIRKPFAASVATARMQNRGEPFDIGFAFWYPDYPDPADVLNVLMSGGAIRSELNTNLAYFDDPVYNRKLAEAAKLTGKRRLEAYGQLDLELSRRESPYVALASLTFPTLYSARIGCQVWSPVPKYELDIAALCLRK